MVNSPAKRTQFPFYYGWVVVIVVALAGFTQSAGTFPVLGVLLDPITTEFGWSHTVFTGATTAGTIVGAVASLFVGRVIDRVGGRWLLTAALFVLGSAFFLMAFINAVWQFYALQIIGRTLTMGVIALALQVIIPKWFVSKRGRAVAIGGMGIMLGNTITPLYVQLAVDVADWRVASAVAGIVIWVVSLLPIAVFLRRQPEDMGLLPDGVSPEKLEQLRASNKEHTVVQEVSYGLRQVLRFPSFYFLAAAFALLFLVGPGMILHMMPYLTGQGIPANQAVWVVATWSASGGIGAFGAGLVADRMGAQRGLIVAFLLMAIAFGVLLLVDNLFLGLLWGVFMGLVGGGAFNTLYQVIFADYYGRESLGTIRSAVWPVQMMTNSAGPLSAAVAFDIFGTYFPVFSTFGLLMVGSAIFISLAKPPQRREAGLRQSTASSKVGAGIEA